MAFYGVFEVMFMRMCSSRGADLDYINTNAGLIQRRIKVILCI
jgi:hypothetical protein